MSGLPVRRTIALKVEQDVIDIGRVWADTIYQIEDRLLLKRIPESDREYVFTCLDSTHRILLLVKPTDESLPVADDEIDLTRFILHTLNVHA